MTQARHLPPNESNPQRPLELQLVRYFIIRLFHYHYLYSFLFLCVSYLQLEVPPARSHARVPTPSWSVEQQQRLRVALPLLGGREVFLGMLHIYEHI